MQVANKTHTFQASLLKAIPLTSREIQIIEAVHRYGLLSSFQIYRCFFEPYRRIRNKPVTRLSSNCHRILNKLVTFNLLQRIFQPSVPGYGSKPPLYLLAEMGANLLAERKQVAVKDIVWQRNAQPIADSKIAHRLKSNDALLAIEVACQKQDITLADYLHEDQLRSLMMLLENKVTMRHGDGRQEKRAVIPDNYLLLTKSSLAFPSFWEIDIGTMTGKSRSRFGTRNDFASKIQRYLALFKEQKHEAIFGVRSMRVFTVTKNESYVQSRKKVTENEGGREQFWFTSFADITAATIFTKPIWSVAGCDKKYPFFAAKKHLSN